MLQYLGREKVSPRCSYVRGGLLQCLGCEEGSPGRSYVRGWSVAMFRL